MVENSRHVSIFAQNFRNIETWSTRSKHVHICWRQSEHQKLYERSRNNSTYARDGRNIKFWSSTVKKKSAFARKCLNTKIWSRIVEMYPNLLMTVETSKFARDDWNINIWSSKFFRSFEYLYKRIIESFACYLFFFSAFSYEFFCWVDNFSTGVEFLILSYTTS